MMFRFILVPLTIGLAGALAVTTAASVNAKKNPLLTLSLSKTNGFALERSVELSISQTLDGQSLPTNGQFPPALAEVGRKAFAKEPTASKAVSAYAMALPSLNKELRRKLMEESQALSRRNRLAIIWMVMSNADSADIDSLVAQYDIALRLGGATAGRLSSNLVQIMSYPQSVELLRTMLLRDPPWAGRFWEKLPSNPASLSNGTTLRIGLVGANLKNAHYEDALLIAALVGKGKYASAERLFSALRSAPRASGEILRNGEFSGVNDLPPFGWETFREGTFYGAIDRLAGTLYLSSTGDSSNTLARQLVELPTGGVMLVIKKYDASDGGTLSIEIRISCAESDGNSTPLIFDVSETNKFKFSNNQSQCRYFWLDIVNKTNLGQGRHEILLDQISLMPL